MTSALETPAERFNRDWAQVQDDRRVRGLDYQSLERASRLYVDPDTGQTPADDDNVNA